MAVDLLESRKSAQGVLGRRVDDVVASRRRQRLKGSLRVANTQSLKNPPTGAERSAYPEVLISAPAVTFEPTRSRVQVLTPTPVVKPKLARDAAMPDPVRVTPSDPMFDTDVEMAQRLATSVREVRTTIESLPVAERVQGPAPVQKYRLTLRGQKAMVALGFAVSIGLGALVGSMLNPGEAASAHTETMTVEAGDSLWSIAAGISAPGQDLRSVVRQIADLNSLETDIIATGQTLVVPAE